MYKKGDAGASSKPIPFLQFSLPSSSPLLKLPNLSNSTNLVSRAFLPFSKGKFLGTSLNFHEWEMPLNGPGET